MDIILYMDWQMIVFYVVGTVFGLYVGRKLKCEDVAEKTIDYLIEMKMIKWRKLDDGEIELLPLDETK